MPHRLAHPCRDSLVLAYGLMGDTISNGKIENVLHFSVFTRDKICHLFAIPALQCHQRIPSPVASG